MSKENLNNDIGNLRKQISLKAAEKQRKASDPDKSVWVEASAGTGKTKVLSDRVLRILLKGINPQRILCLTYTKAAAVEMSSRIAGRLSKWAVLGDEELKEELKALLGELLPAKEEYKKLEAMARRLLAVLLDTPGGVKIQTIHSFCQDVLKRFPLEAKISPYFEVMDERASKEILDEVKIKLLKKIENNDDKRLNEALAYLTVNVSEFKFPEILGSITDARNKITRLLSGYANVDTMLDKLAEKLGVNKKDTKDSAIDEFWRKTDKEGLKKIMQALHVGGKKESERAEYLEKYLAENKFEPEGYKKVFIDSKGEIRSLGKKALEIYADTAAVFEREACRFLDLENRLVSIDLFAATKAVLFLSEELINGYNQYKKLNSKMDYEDLIVITRDLLADKSVADWVMYKLDGGIDNLLIDEAQDTSPDQWEIVKNLTAEFFAGKGAKSAVRTVFAVGDRKQSIYSFQGADPTEFEKMHKHFSNQTQGFEKVQLDVSFRSTDAVLSTVDEIFKNENVAKGVALDGAPIEHVAFRKGDAGRIEIWPLIEPEEGENPDEWRPPVEVVTASTTSTRLAKEIALRIKKSVDDKDVLLSQNRSVRYKDFLILVQRRNVFVEELIRECKNAGVSVAGIDKIRLLEQIAIQDLIALGKFLLLPTDDLNLATVLKSPLFGLDDDDLFKICHKRKSTVWTNLSNFAEYKEIYKTLQELLNMADLVRPFELYSHVLSKLGGRKKFVERMGLDVEDGLDEFVNLTIDFEKEHIPLLQKFIDRVSKDQVEIKRELEQSEIDAVRIMTVHGSKGLQAPIVILPDTIRVPKMKKEGKILWDEDILYCPLSSAYYEKNTAAINEKEKKLMLEEYRRLLYVALTRAEDRLCICGYRKKQKASDDSWFEIAKQGLGGEEDFVNETKQEVFVKEKEEKFFEEQKRPHFDWINNPASEEKILAKPYTPSKPDEEETALMSPIGDAGESRYRRGKIIHKILQFVPDAEGDKEKIIRQFLDKNAADFSDAQKQRIVKEVLDLLNNPQFSLIFGKNSKAEVSVIGQAGGKIISATIDRLAVFDDKVIVVDYKTNRPAALRVEDIPPVYVKQMAAYKELLENIYPAKEIKMFILWTDTANLMELG